jgi:hypothetical protein
MKLIGFAAVISLVVCVAPFSTVLCADIGATAASLATASSDPSSAAMGNEGGISQAETIASPDWKTHLKHCDKDDKRHRDCDCDYRPRPEHCRHPRTCKH